MGGTPSDSPVSNLSPAELEVMHLIGLGMGTSEIAEKLARSVKTIESHKANIKKKLDLDSGSQLTLFAINLFASQV
jgi:DNA-binding NarL/FixJ family response regulator